MNRKERFLKTLNGEPVDRIPVFPLLMSFSAKHYGVTYQQFASDGEIMAQSQLCVLDKFGIDVITACSDAFRISADLGGDIVFPEDKPPFIENPLVGSEADLKLLLKPDPSDKKTRMYDRAKGVREMVKGVRDQAAVLGWVDMPFAEACSLCGVENFMVMLYDEPVLAHRILEFLTDIVIEFSLFQLEQGAVMIGAGDAAASLLSPDLYREFALSYEQRVVNEIHNKGGLVKLHICGNTTKIIGDMVKTKADLFNVDHLVDFDFAKEIYAGNHLTFKGNLDPVADMLLATPEDCFSKVLNCVTKAKGSKYVLSAGCEVPKDVTDEVFNSFCKAVK